MSTPDDVTAGVLSTSSRLHSSSVSTRGRSSSATRSTKRSPSPLVTYSSDSKARGVKNITRKVIRTLEGLGHLEDMTEREQDECDSETSEVDATGVAHPHDGLRLRQPQQNGSAAAVAPPQVKKIDWEIPRKLLHSSIGFFTLYLYLSNGSVHRVVVVLWSALAVIVPADILRLRWPAFARVYERLLGFLMRESERKSTNGVIWYILGVNFALTFYPQDVATVAILILSWADTTASTFGRLLGPLTPPLPRRTPVLRLPLAPRKSLAGFVAAVLTGAIIAWGFWGWVAPLRHSDEVLSWYWDGGVRAWSTLLSTIGWQGKSVAGAGGWLGLCALSVVAGLVSGVAEALGAYRSLYPFLPLSVLRLTPDSTDLGSLDDNLTLPIISGGCILGFLKLLGLFSTPP
ncbi:hypothetical protein DXG03_007584 [Asterophora parasitica]|uniref:Phosphatidate cytidylyltransferase n=1 Tax=Asterophora parasitica TaxID=117018 RepID=A0A9P7G8I8_9AGAR|nr:hypothetical protein DXG03_007584 [Asterophora parasitica]